VHCKFQTTVEFNISPAQYLVEFGVRVSTDLEEKQYAVAVENSWPSLPGILCGLCPQNSPILRGGLENADLFPMSSPASWCFLIPKRYSMEVSNLSKNKNSVENCEHLY
jgi:hypothetical protein